MTTKEAAEILNTSDAVIRQWADAGRIQGKKTTEEKTIVRKYHVWDLDEESVFDLAKEKGIDTATNKEYK